jgi:hypothetical protein
MIMAVQNRLALWLVIAIALPVLLLQAWDSDVFASNALVIALVLLGIALPVAAALVMPKDSVLIGAGLIAALLFFVARFISPIALQSDLFTIFPLMGVLLYFSHVQRLKLAS